MSEQTDNARQEPVQQPAVEPENTPNQTPEPENDVDKAPISQKKRTALLRYMAVLFGVAFLLVLLSFLIQIRDSRETISDLNQSNASALQNAVKLQEANQTLTADKAALEEQLAEAEAAMAQQEETTADLEEQLQEAEETADSEEALRRSYELLFLAARHYESGDYTACMNVLEEQLQPEDVEAFTQDAQDYWQLLKTRCLEQLDAAADAEE